MLCNSIFAYFETSFVNFETRADFLHLPLSDYILGTPTLKIYKNRFKIYKITIDGWFSLAGMEIFAYL